MALLIESGSVKTATPSKLAPKAASQADDKIIGSLAKALSAQAPSLELKPEPARPATPAASQERLTQQLSLSRPVAAVARPSSGGTWALAASAKSTAAPPAAFAPPPAPPRSEAQQAVDQALEEGGPAAAGQELREQTENMSPEEASQLLAPELVDSITQHLGEQSANADGNGRGALQKQQEIDQIVADLAAAAERGDEDSLRRVTESIVKNIDPQDVGRFDEALGNAVGSGSGARLSISVVNSLAKSGRKDQADDILQNVQFGTDQLRKKADGLADKVEGFNSQLGRLISDWQGLLTPEELEAATQAFRDSHPEYAEQDRLAGALVNTANQLSQLPPGVAKLGHADDVQGANRKLISEQLVRLGGSDAAVAALSEIQLDHVSGKPDLLSEIEAMSTNGKLNQEEKDALASMNVSAAVQNALSGENADAFEPLGDLSATIGLKKADLHALVDGLGNVLEGRAPGQVEDLLEDFTDSLEAAGAKLSPRVFHSLSGAGLLAGAVGTYGSVDAALRDPNFDTVSAALVDVSGTGMDGLSLLSSFKNIKLAESAGFKVAGKVVGGVGAALDVYSALKSLSEGDLPEAGLHAAAAASGIAIMAGGAWTGPGVVLALGAAAALVQLGRVRASNVQENEHTEAFLRGAGVSDPKVTYHLRDADSEGRSVGPVLSALAQHMNIEPTELFDWLSKLPPDQVIDFVHAMHGVDPDKEGKFPVTASNDRQVNPETRQSSGRGGFDSSPHSLEGLETWLQVNDYNPPV